jgi:hypothetical protein
MIHALLGRLALLLGDWSARCLHEMDGWSDLTPAGKERRAAATFRDTQALLRGESRGEADARKARREPVAQARATRKPGRKPGKKSPARSLNP